MELSEDQNYTIFVVNYFVRLCYNAESQIDLSWSRFKKKTL